MKQPLFLGFYYFGASGGREWFIDPEKKFKDTALSEKQLTMLDKVKFQIFPL